MSAAYPLPDRLLAGRFFDVTGPAGDLVCVDLLAQVEHDPLPHGGVWHLPSSAPVLGPSERTVLGRAVMVARGLLPRYSGAVSPGDPDHVACEQDGLAGHPCWVITDLDDPEAERLGVAQIVGWLRPRPEGEAGYLVRAVTAIRDAGNGRVAEEGAIILLHGTSVVPIPVGEDF